MHNQKEKYLHSMLSETTDQNLVNFSTRLSSFKNARRRTRTSIVPQFSVDVNSAENTYETHVNEDDQNEALAGYLIKPIWNVSRVSPLHNLHCGVTKLKQYASKIKQSIIGSPKCESNLQYDVAIDIVENLKLEINHSDALEITVDCSAGLSNPERRRNVYTGVLFSWGRYAAEDGSKATHLPLLLDRGQEKITTIVRQVLTKLFDCVITTYRFNESELLLFTALLSSFVSRNESKMVTLTYNVPCTRSPTRFEITLSADDLYNMWLSCFPGERIPNVHDEKSSQELYAAFQNHIKYAYDVNLARMELTHLKYPSVHIQSKGKIQLKDVEVTKCVLRILCEMSVILKGSKPKLAVDYD